MLNKDIDKVVTEDGKVVGLKSGEEFAKAKVVIASPTYAINSGLKDRVKVVGRVIRCICILDHPIPETKSAPSVQIIIPQRQVGRKSDIYIMMVSSPHQVCKAGFYIAIISANVETTKPEEEIKVALDLIGTVKERFVTISELYEPVNESSDNFYITNLLTLRVTSNLPLKT